MIGLLAVLLFGLKGHRVPQPFFPSVCCAGASLCAFVANLSGVQQENPGRRAAVLHQAAPLMDSPLSCPCFPCCILPCAEPAHWLEWDPFPKQPSRSLGCAINFFFNISISYPWWGEPGGIPHSLIYLKMIYHRSL